MREMVEDKFPRGKRRWIFRGWREMGLEEIAGDKPSGDSKR